MGGANGGTVGAVLVWWGHRAREGQIWRARKVDCVRMSWDEVTKEIEEMQEVVNMMEEEEKKEDNKDGDQQEVKKEEVNIGKAEETFSDDTTHGVEQIPTDKKETKESATTSENKDKKETIEAIKDAKADLQGRDRVGESASSGTVLQTRLLTEILQFRTSQLKRVTGGEEVGGKQTGEMEEETKKAEEVILTPASSLSTTTGEKRGGKQKPRFTLPNQVWKLSPLALVCRV